MNINQVIKKFFKDNHIPLYVVAGHLGISPSNLTNRLNSERAITVDEFFILYKHYKLPFLRVAYEYYYKSFDVPFYFLEVINTISEIQEKSKGLIESLNKIDSLVNSSNEELKKTGRKSN